MVGGSCSGSSRGVSGAEPGPRRAEFVRQLVGRAPGARVGGQECDCGEVFEWSIVELGLRFARWRARVAAAELLSSLAECDLDRGKADAQVLEELLQALVFRTGLCDSQWQGFAGGGCILGVRQAAVPAATKLLAASQGLLPQPLRASLTWGVLAICVDPQPEVQAVARDAVLQHLIPPSKVHSKGVVQALPDKFIAAVLKEETSDSASRVITTL